MGNILSVLGSGVILAGIIYIADSFIGSNLLGDPGLDPKTVVAHSTKQHQADG